MTKAFPRVFACFAALLVAQASPAQTWPDKPVKFVIPFAPGGPADIVARLTGQKLTEILGQAVIVESRAGAGGNIGAAAVAKSAPDGYTALVTTSAFAVNVSLSPNSGYDAERDFIPVAAVAKQANLIFVNPGLPAKTVAELIALARTRKLAFASPGSGTTPHLTAENLFNLISKLDIPAIHFRGAGPSATAVVGGEPPVGAGAISTPLPFVKSGKLRALAVSSASRVAALPDVPTLAEAGFPGFNDDTWIGIFLPAGTSPAIVQKLNEAINKALQSADMRERLDALAFEPVGGTPPQFAAYVKAEIAKWGKVVREGNIKAE
ncbi:MAG TPA: tripartite tricarboxylate transporter substrate binding protein [Burkholderiales bacterium]|nr:tripartite tricarboxylate transporter substrate binding protein [Burkholderiales bacterium]